MLFTDKEEEYYLNDIDFFEAINFYNFIFEKKDYTGYERRICIRKEEGKDIEYKFIVPIKLFMEQQPRLDEFFARFTFFNFAPKEHMKDIKLYIDRNGENYLKYIKSKRENWLLKGDEESINLSKRLKEEVEDKSYLDIGDFAGWFGIDCNFFEELYIDVNDFIDKEEYYKKAIDKYIERFKNNRLKRHNTNYLIYKKQIDAFIEKCKIEDKRNMYGNDFILKYLVFSFEYGTTYPTKTLFGKENEEREFLFFHTLFALSKDNFLEIEHSMIVENHTTIEDDYEYEFSFEGKKVRKIYFEVEIKLKNKFIKKYLKKKKRKKIAKKINEWITETIAIFVRKLFE